MYKLTTSFFVIICLLFNGCTKAQDKNIAQPNVLFIMVDDYNDYSGVLNGHPQAITPNIDRLAQSGTNFINAHTNAPVCQPSRNSLFIGVYPHNSKDYGWTPHFKQVQLKHRKTFIELFKENGYQTIGTGKLLHKNRRQYWDEWGVPEGINYGPHAYSGIDENGKRIMGHSSVPEPFRSINVVDGSFASLADTPTIKDENGNIIETGWTFGRKPYRYVNDEERDLLPDEQHAEFIVNKLETLSKQDSVQPFFMGVGFVNPHTPLYAPQKYFDMYPLESIQIPIIKDNDIDDIYYSTVYEPSEMGLAYFRKLRQSYPNGNEGLRRFLQAYLACVTFMDDQVGKVLDALEQSKFKDNTVVIFVSDHGWQMGEKEYLYKNSPWDKSTRIPFIIKDPSRSNAGDSVKHPVSLIDIFPTLLDVCNLNGELTRNTSAGKLDGFSLQPFLNNPNTTDWNGSNGALTVLGAGINQPIEGIAFNSNPSALWHIEVTKDLDDSYTKQQNFTYRSKDWRYILYKNGKEELYHNSEDPNEWYNLANDPNYKKIKDQLKSEMLDIIYP